METVANESGFYKKIRLIEGLTVLLQSFGGELLMFPLSGKLFELLLKLKVSNVLQHERPLSSSILTSFEMIFMTGKIIKAIGYGNALTLCFLFFAVRFFALSFIPNPWWTLPIETVLFGVTYAFSYCTIVAYVSTISSAKIRGTMQGIVSGCYDGIGKIMVWFGY